MAVENLFPSYKGCNGIDGNRRHAEATEAAQAAWDRAVAANARNQREADERRKRRRWKDSKGRIYEWDSQHGKVEIYSPQGTTHLGEFDPETGEQTKPAKPGRTTPK